MKPLHSVPFDELQVGDRVVTNTGVNGIITTLRAQLYRGVDSDGVTVRDDVLQINWDGVDFPTWVVHSDTSDHGYRWVSGPTFSFRVKRWWKRNSSLFFPLLVVLGVFAFLGYALHQSNARNRDFTQRCNAAGGKISTLRRGLLCLSDDGRVLGNT